MAKNSPIPAKTDVLNVLTLSRGLLRAIDYPDLIIEAVARYWGADAASFWEAAAQYRQDKFSLRGTFNRPQITDYKDCFFSIRSRKSRTSRAFSEKKPIIGEIGDDIFGVEWSSKPSVQDIVDRKLNYIALIPIFSKQNRPQFSISLFSTKPWSRFHEDQWIEFSNFFSDYWNIYRDEFEAIKQINGSFRHEVDNQILSIERDIGIVSANINELSIELEVASFLLEDQLLGDLKNIEQTLGFSISNIQDALSSIKYSNENKKFYNIVLDRKFKSGWVDLERAIKESIESLLKDNKPISSILSKLEVPREMIQILMNRIDVRHLFTNIFSNALKYRVHDAPIVVTITEDNEFLNLSVHNLSNWIPREEIHMVWEHGVRSSGALASSVTGSGLGLATVRSVCDAYKVRYEFKQSASAPSGIGLAGHNNVDGQCWSRITLRFPQFMVR